MDWSYSGDPESSPMDRVRSLVGDTDRSDPLISNLEIEDALAAAPTIRAAAADICRRIAARLSRESDYEVDDVSKRLSQRADAFAARAREIEASRPRRSRHVAHKVAW